MIKLGRPEKKFLRLDLDHPISESQLGPEHFHVSISDLTYARTEHGAAMKWVL